jgi:phosphate transport system substrate-binding protein
MKQTRERTTMLARVAWGLAMAGLAALGLLAGSLRVAAREPALIRIDGSSTVFPVTEAVAEEFQKQTRGTVRVTVGISGTGGGFKKFCRGETDVQDASRPILRPEMEACARAGVQYVELPVAFDALTVVVHPTNTWAEAMSVAELKKIWEPAAQGRITRWSQVRAGWPDAPLKLFGAGADSGTFDYFTEAVVGRAKASRGDYTASEDDNVLVQGVARDRYALGYFGFAYFEANRSRLKAVAIDGGRGPVAPSRETVENGRYVPLSRPIFIYVSQRAAQRREVQEFVRFYLQHARTLVEQVKYVPLPDRAYTLALERFVRGRVGTAFGGEAEVGVRIEEILTREPRS